MTRLFIAEKPSMAREIARALGAVGQDHGCIVGGDVIVTWCIGHLVELAEPQDYDPRHEEWALGALPIIPEAFRLVAVERTKAQFRIVRDLLARPDVHEVVNACDSGREGELIFDYVYRLARCQKRVLRLWTASLTDEAIRTAFRQLKPAEAYAGLRDAARSRSEADWLVGMNGTRAQTLVARAGGQRGVWSLGRVQTPTLALLVNRAEAIRTFVVQDYWTIEADLQARGGAFAAKWFRIVGDKSVEKLEREEEAKGVAAAARRGPATVLEVDAKAVSVAAERLYDLTTLQREANRRFGYSAQRTLELAQALYEQHKVLSYPRTNSRHLTTDVAATLPTLLAALERQPDFAPAAALARQRSTPLGTRFVDDSKVEDHHALIPTGRVPGQLDQAERHIYDLIVRRFLGAFYPERVEARTQVTCLVGGERFCARGLQVRTVGWAAVDPPAAEAKERKDDDSTPLPALQARDSLQVLGVKAVARKTKPPRPYTEAELLGAMETAGRTLEDEEQRLAMKESGLGTPATRAAVIEHLLAREYAVRARKNLEPTPRGIALVEGLKGTALTSALLTGQWEAKLARMARGEYPRARFMGELATYVRELVAQIAAAPPPRPAQVAEASRHTAPAGRPPKRASRGGSTRPTHAAAATSPAARPSPSAARPAPASTSPPAVALRPGAPAATACPGCTAVTRVIWSAAKNAWFKRCDPCGRWL